MVYLNAFGENILTVFILDLESASLLVGLLLLICCLIIHFRVVSDEGGVCVLTYFVLILRVFDCWGSSRGAILDRAPIYILEDREEQLKIVLVHISGPTPRAADLPKRDGVELLRPGGVDTVGGPVMSVGEVRSWWGLDPFFTFPYPLPELIFKRKYH